MELTREEAIRLHRKMWRWLRDETLRAKRPATKREYFEAMGIAKDDKLTTDCYLCEYKTVSGNYTCCIVEWNHEDFCLSKDSPFKKWVIATRVGDWETAVEMAGIIAELPERKVD